MLQQMIVFYRFEFRQERQSKKNKRKKKRNAWSGNVRMAACSRKKKSRGKLTYVGSVSDNFVLDFFPSLEGFFDEDLGTQRKTLSREISELVLVVGEARTKTSEREGGSKNDRVSNGGGGLERIVDGSDSRGLGGRNIDFCRVGIKK